MIDKIKQLFYDSTVGLVEDYRKRVMELVKIHAATFYLQAVKALRQHVVMLCTMLFMVLVAAIAAVILPAVLILTLPIATGWKVAAVVLLAVIDISVPAFYLQRIFSDQQWIKNSQADEFVKDAMNN